MKRLTGMLLWILLLCCAARAEGLGTPEAVRSALDRSPFGGKVWTEEAGGRVQSLALDADTVITLCADGGSLVAVSVTAPQSREDLAELAAAALGALVPEDAVRQALGTGAPQSIGENVLTVVVGATRTGVYLCPGAALDALYWLPMHGGEDRHRSPLCSGMDVPRLVTAAAADALGFPPCSKCAGGATGALDDAA